MSFRIIVDSCCDKTEFISKLDNITFVPLTLQLGDYIIPDDENFDQNDYVKRVAEYDSVPKTACPAPDAWAKAFDCEENDIYVVTITDKLSGTYNSAVQGKQIFEEEHKDKNIHIFNSLATAGAESLIVEKIVELVQGKNSFDDVCKKVEDYIQNESKLFFCLESLDVLKNNGRLFALAASVLEKLKVKLICKAKDGNISLAAQDIAMNRAMVKISRLIAESVEGRDLTGKRVVISHVCCPERAQLLADKIKSATDFKDIEIVKCSGLNTTYASNGGIIVSYNI
ncbi:MAG: DegV family protein [Eubacterium sp.]